LEIMRLARDLGVVFAFPTQTLHLDSVAAPGAERALPPPFADEKLADVVRAFGPSGERSSPKGPKIVAGGFVAKPELANHPE
jgi:MscS family membrane protein